LKKWTTIVKKEGTLGNFLFFKKDPPFQKRPLKAKTNILWCPCMNYAFYAVSLHKWQGFGYAALL